MFLERIRESYRPFHRAIVAMGGREVIIFTGDLVKISLR
jgi:predicted N-formylglutamate amidohydrolase